MSIVIKRSKGKPAISEIHVSDDKIIASLSDGREVSIPISWFPRLAKATSEQRSRFTISPQGYGIHWPDIDEDISIKAFLS